MKSPALFSSFLAAAFIVASAGFASRGSAQDMQIFAPKEAPAPAVILISGVSGTALYQDYGKAISELGYTAVLVAGKDVSNKHGASAENFRKVIAALHTDPRVKPGKVSVIGFSLGGGGALLHAASQSEIVASVVAYYPAVTGLPSVRDAGSKVAVPTLILAGERDRYNNCCLIESIRDFEAAALGANAQVTLISYAQADHGFNLNVPAYRAGDAADAWARVQEFLSKTMPR